MKNLFRVAVLLSLPLFAISACKKEEAAKPAVVAAAVTMPTDPSKPFGDAKRNSVRGPNFRQFDMAAIKRISLPRSARIELRLEAFNLFNRVNYGPVNGNRSSAAFGTITSTYDARQLQLGAKFLW